MRFAVRTKERASKPPPSAGGLFVWRAAMLIAATACSTVALTAFVIVKGAALELPAWVRLVAAPIACLAAALAFRLIRSVRRSYLQRARQVAEFDASKPFVLYLRSFDDDEMAAQATTGVNEAALLAYTTEEEAIVEAFKPLGQVIAIGRPGELMPELGAIRFYVSDDQWQEVVRNWIAKAELVVLRYGTSAGLNWELEQCIRTLRPEQLVVLVPRGAEQGSPLTSALAQLTGQPVPEFPKAPGFMGAFGHCSFAGYLQFGPGWTITPRRLHFGGFRERLSSLWSLDLWQPMVHAFAAAFRPVYESLGRRWAPPRSHWLRNAFILAGMMATVTAAVVFIFRLWEPESLRREREKNEEFRRSLDEMMRNNRANSAKLKRSIDETLKGLKQLDEIMGKSNVGGQPTPTK
jgi:hypothetical protein